MNNSQSWLAFTLSLIVFASGVQSLNRITWYFQEFLSSGLSTLLLLMVLSILIWIILSIRLKNIRSIIARTIGYTQRKLINRSADPKSIAIQQLQITTHNLYQLRDKKQADRLLQEQMRLGEELNRKELVAVVFGIGSSGKTSLIRALIGRPIGKVKASMGSTHDSSQYRISLNKTEKKMILVDTPGIFESGHEGYRREIKARWEVSRADLVLMVVDGDLRSDEETIIHSLVAVGKRLMLILNKCDLWEEHEEEHLLKELRLKCENYISPLDIVSVSSVSGVSLTDAGNAVFSQPEIQRLTQRVTDILVMDSETLIMKNVALQCHYLYEASHWLLKQQRQIDAQKIIGSYMWVSTGVTMINQIPSLDLLSMVAVNTRMVIEIARLYRVEIDFAIAKALVVSIGHALVSLGIVNSGMVLIRSALSLNTPVLLISKAVQIVTLAWLTRLIGLSFITYFEQNQEWGERGIDGVVQYYFDLNKKSVLLRHFLEVSYSRIIEPLKIAQRE